jgi:probable phosphoglycerate mutase
MAQSRRVFLVRHGESEWNLADLVQGQSANAPGLTQTGVEQASLAAKILADTQAELVLSSDLRRATQTAGLIATRLSVPLRLDPRLRERALGTAEGRSSVALDPSETGHSGDIVTDADARPPGGESLRQLCARISELLSELCAGSSDRPVVLVTHGGTIRAARAYFEGVNPEQMSWPPVPNGSVLEVVGSTVTRRL